MRKFDSINVIPFIDIMLVLLAIVLTTATFVNNGQLDINLPQSTGSSTASNTEKVEIAIDSDEQLFFNAKPTTLEQLADTLSSLDRTTSILLRIDETVPFNRFVSVVDLLKRLELDRVSVLTKGISTADTAESTSGSTLGQ